MFTSEAQTKKGLKINSTDKFTDSRLRLKLGAILREPLAKIRLSDVNGDLMNPLQSEMTHKSIIIQ